MSKKKTSKCLGFDEAGKQRRASEATLTNLSCEVKEEEHTNTFVSFVTQAQEALCHQENRSPGFLYHCGWLAENTHVRKANKPQLATPIPRKKPPKKTQTLENTPWRNTKPQIWQMLFWALFFFFFLQPIALIFQHTSSMWLH